MPKKVKVAKAPQNLIWIELAKPRDKAHAEQQCELANRMLEKLCDPKDRENQRKFFTSDGRYPYCFGGPMGYTELADRGEWFNLDYLGREVK